MEPIPDFTKRRSFPGTTDNDFDFILRRADDVEKIPALLFAGLLFLIAIPPTIGHWGWTFGLWAFFLIDWLLLALLPRTGRSYGNPKPGTLILAVLRMLFAFLPFPVAVGLQAIGTLLVVDSFWIEPQRLTVTRQSLRSPKLVPGKPVRVLHLGDLHVERFSRRERYLNRLIQELKPDLILFSGDVINLSYVEDPTAWQAARDILSQWRAQTGTYVVTGSPAVDLEHVFPQLVEGLDNLCWLRDERVTVQVNGQAIDIIGLTCTHRPFIDGPTLERVLTGGDTETRGHGDAETARQEARGRGAADNSLSDSHSGDHFTILLYHTPDLAPNAANTGKIDLQLSGHTHGGQVRLPGFGALFAASLYGKRFESGRRTVGSLTLYVTRGIGLEGKAAPRARFFCPPEIILWEIDGEEK